MSLRRRFRKLAIWGMATLLAIVVGGAIAAYNYVTEGDQLAEAIRREGPRFLPNCRVDVIRARIRPFAGEVMLHSVTVNDNAAGGGALVASFPYVQVNFNPWAMLDGRFEPTEIIIPRPTVRLRRRADGSWNLQDLLADPWPGPKGGATPPVRVKDGTVELVGEGAGQGAVLRVLSGINVDVEASSGDGQPIPFEVSAKSDLFERLKVVGSVDAATGRLAVDEGELVRLTLSDSLRNRLPAEAAAALDRSGLTSGEVDASVESMSFDPLAARPLRFSGSARLRKGLWNCPDLPFPIADVSADLEVRDDQVFLTSARGSDGLTQLSARGKFRLGDPARAPFEVSAEATNLLLDNRLRGRTPAKFLEVWELYFPEVSRSKSASAGVINVAVRLGRPSEGAEVDASVDVDLLDVSMQYRHFPYRVEHVKGRMHATPRRLTLENVNTLVGGRPLRVDGTVDNPGPDAVADLKFAVEALPIDDTFMKALPPDVRNVVDDFRPSGTVRGAARLVRKPRLRPADDPIGRITFDATIDLNRGCSATWDGLKYPVRDLTGQLEIHPDLWVFRHMEGKNGQAVVRADGQVVQVRKDKFKVDLAVSAENLPFNQELRDALPKPWQLTWDTLNPTGSSDIDARVIVEPARPDRYRVAIRPRPKTGVNLRFVPTVAPEVAQPAGVLELQMDDVSGQFVFDTSTSPPMTMSDVNFTFQRAPVSFALGQVDVKDSGAFALGVTRLEVSDLLLDEGLRRMMPPVMAAAARRLDDRKIPKIRADLGLGWSGKPGTSAWCRWSGGLVALINNKVTVSEPDLCLEHIQGQFQDVSGAFDGQDLKLGADALLDSVSVLGQQLTALQARIDVRDNVADVAIRRVGLLGGTVQGNLSASLDATPAYSVGLTVDGANLQEYARTQSGHQAFKGRIAGRVDLKGVGGDLHNLNGHGHFRVSDGDLGTLPAALRFVNVLKQAQNTKAVFDSADVGFRINNGETLVKPVKLTGNTFSLEGGGTVDVRGEMDLKLELLAGRDNWHIPLVSDLTRELSGLFGAIRVEGPIADPTFRPEPLPPAGERLRTMSRARSLKGAGIELPHRVGAETKNRSATAPR